ncbi:MAG: transglycosylase SLT domain-containing protein [Geminicoccaceae bacterium]|nr:transglycosylase SLT domain-containing protein [Geminicoccaceae bacterium]
MSQGLSAALHLCAFCLCLLLASASARAQGWGGACLAAAGGIERGRGIPDGLLYAVSLAESGRWDPEARRGFAWPWTVRAGADAFVLDTKPEAIRTVRRLRAEGRRNIDVGCAQINLMYHPDAFRDLEEAFDPAANLAYAAGFLVRLKGETGSWEDAVARYHSADPARGPGYREKVYRHWASLEGAPTETVLASLAASATGAVPGGGRAPGAGAIALQGLFTLPQIVAGPARRAGQQSTPARVPPGAIAILRPSGASAAARGLWSVIRPKEGGQR